MTAPGLAHEVVNQALALTGRSVEWGKSKPGMFKSVIERVEGPVNATLSSGPARSVIKVGDRVLTTVDKSIESAMNTSTYKSGEAFVRNQYSNRIVPATNTVTTTVVTTTSRVTTPVVNTYMGVLKFADKQVEYYLPEPGDASKHLPVTVVSVAKKMTRRSVKRVKGARKWTADSVGKMTKATKSNLKFAYDVAKPSSIKRNTVKVYKTAFDNTDKIIDRLLPGKGDILIAKGPITLVNKIGKRVVFHSLAQVKAAATAIKNSPATFKKSLNASIALAKLQLERIKDMTLQFQYKSYNYLLPYIEVAQKRSLTLVAAADKILMQYPMTKYVRNFAVTKYDGLVAPVLNRYLTAPAEKEAAASPAKSSSEEKMLWPPQEKDVPADELEDELEAEGIPAETMDSSTASKKKKKSKKKAVDAETTESAAYC